MSVDLKKAIAQKRSNLIRAATQAKHDGNLEGKADIEMRLRFLMSLEARLQAEGDAGERPKLFISYSVKTGSEYYKTAAERAGEFGFDVHNGFRRTQDKNVLNAVRTAISEAAMFLVIMTPDLAIQVGDRASYAPSVWVVEEKGMALALGKPFRMLVDRSVHADFWQRTTPGNLHHVFEQPAFESHLVDALSALQRRYDEIQLARLGLASALDDG